MSNGLSTADELAEMARPSAQPQSSLVPRFYIDTQQNAKKTKDAGHPVFDDVEMVEIHVPGDRDFTCHEVTDRDREMFAAQYRAFKRKETQESVSGFPLAQWAQMRRSQVEEARALGVYTIEQLAGIPDVLLQRFGAGWIPLRQLARDWVKNAEDGSHTAKLRSELDAAVDRIKTLETMLAKQAQELHRDPSSTVGAVQYVAPSDDKIAKLEEMVAKLAAAQAPSNGTAPKRRGRPPKAKPEPAPGA